MLAEPYRTAGRKTCKHALQQLLALEKRHGGQVVAVEIEQIERVIAHALLARLFQGNLQVAERGKTRLVFDDGFAVDQRRAELKACDRFGNAVETVRPIE